MKVLIIGSGGKTHAIIHKLSQSSALSNIYTTFKNAEAQKLAEYVDIMENDAEKLSEFIKSNEIMLAVVESESAINAGIADVLRKENIAVFGAGAASSKIEN